MPCCSPFGIDTDYKLLSATWTDTFPGPVPDPKPEFSAHDVAFLCAHLPSGKLEVGARLIEMYAWFLRQP